MRTWFVWSVAFAAAPSAAQDSAFALRFYGTGVAPPGQQDRARIPIDDDAPGLDASTPCDVGAAGFTIDFWIRGSLASNATADSGGDNESLDLRWINGNIVVDRDIFGGSQRDWGISIAGGFVRFGVGRGDSGVHSENTIEGNINVLNGAWHHVACTRDFTAGQLRIFVDGLLDFAGGANVNRANLSYPNDGAPGALSPWGPYIVLAAEKHDAGPGFPSFNGFMDEFRVWNVALSQSQILSRFDRVLAPGSALAAGLVGSYRFEEGSDTSLANSSGSLAPAGVLIAGTPGNGEWVARSVDFANVAPVSAGSLPVGFVRETVIDTGLTEPTVMEFLPDGRLLIGQRGGAIRIYQDGVLLPAPLITIATITQSERGLVGLARDPNFASNGYIYVYYTTSPPRNRVGRFTVSGNTANPASEVIIWQNPDPAANFHHGGAIAFGADGNLYIATGDQFTSANAQTLVNEHGKLLRLAPDGSIPPDNPFVATPDARPAIWALGLRNPFRFTIDSLTGRILIGNVGGNSGSSWEEINVGLSGANYGWPNQEGSRCFIPDCSAYTFPIFFYQHNNRTYAPGPNQASILAGPVYRSTAFPSAYRGVQYVGDYANRWIRRLVFDAAGNVLGDPLFVTEPLAGTIIDMEVGPDGALYFLTYGVAWDGVPDTPGLHRVRFLAPGNQPPVAVAAATPTLGPLPLSVQFSSAGSSDADNGPSPLAFAWNFGDGGTSNAPNPQHTFTTEGQFTVLLTVSDGLASAPAAPLLIRVGIPPIVTISEPAPGATYRAGDTITFSGSASDAKDGPLPVTALTWQVLLIHEEHAHPFVGPLVGVTGGSFQIPTTGHAPAHTFYQIRLTATDSDTLSTTATRDAMPEIAMLALNSNPSGVPIFLDGDAVKTPAVIPSLISFQHEVAAQPAFMLNGLPYVFSNWSDAGAATHTVVLLPAGLSLTAMYVLPPIATVQTSIAANDRNAEHHLPAGAQFANSFDPFGLCCGSDSGGEYQLGLEFSLAVPPGATIQSAVLSVVATADQSATPTARIRAYAVGDSPPFAAGNPTPLSSFQPLTTAAVDWAFPAFIPAQSYNSPGLAALVQEVVNRPDWAGGNFIGFVWNDITAEAGDRWRCIRNFASSQPAVLTVSYRPPGACAGHTEGDSNCDGQVSVGDIGFFVSAVTGGQPGWTAKFAGGAATCAFVCVNDVNGDGSVGVGDIGAFVAILTDG